MKAENKKILISFIWRILLLALLIAGLFVLRSFQQNPDLCESFARGWARNYIYAASRITNLIPFSLTEVFYVVGISSIIAIVISLIMLIVKKNYVKAGKRILNVACIVLSLIVLYTSIFTLSYARHSVVPYLNLEEVEEINVDLCAEASAYYVSEVIALSDNFEFDEEGNVICPYTFDQLQELINKEFHRFDGGYLSDFEVKAKPVLSSVLMSYSGITGQFFSFFGESNVSTDLIAYQLPETIAHEIAHAKGVSRENEANYVAYYLLLTSENDYLRYCGMMMAANKMLAESYDKDNSEPYFETAKLFSQSMWTQYQNVNDHWDFYDTFWDDIMEKINDMYLKSSGQADGVKSYSQTGRFILSIYLNHHKPISA